MSTCPPTGDAVEMGEGYTEQLRLQTVLKTGSAHQFQHLQNTCKDKSESQTQSFCLPGGGICFLSRPSHLRTEPKTAGVIPTSKSDTPLLTLIKKIVWTPSKKIDLIHQMGGKAVSSWRRGVVMLQVRQRRMIYTSVRGEKKPTCTKVQTFQMPWWGGKVVAKRKTLKKAWRD